MNSCTEACAQLRCAVADLVRVAQSDLAPPDKLELLCTQIGTAAHLLVQPPQQAPASGLPGPHFAELWSTDNLERSSKNSRS